MKKLLIITSSLLLSLSINLKAQNPVKTYEGVKIGGIKQWIGTKSNDDSKPILLFLHGGPGFSSRSYSKKFIKLLQKDFIIAQWDQRGTGITNAWSPTDSLSIDLMHSDTEEVVKYLLKKFNREKLYLVGFSWGGFLGHHFADKHPDLLHAYISVSSMIYNNESEKLTLNRNLELAKQSNNAEALKELSGIKLPFVSWEGLYYQRKWTAYYSTEKGTTKHYPKSLFKEWSVKWMPVFLEASRINYTETIPKINCPIYFFISKNDFVANYKITQKYFNQLKAPKKEINWFNESTHEIPNQTPRKFSEELIKISKPKE